MKNVVKTFKFLVICSLFGASVFAGFGEHKAAIFKAFVDRDQAAFQKAMEKAAADPSFPPAEVSRWAEKALSKKDLTYIPAPSGEPSAAEEAARLAAEAEERRKREEEEAAALAARLAAEEEERRKQEEAASEALAKQLAAEEEEAARLAAGGEEPLPENLTQARQGLALPWDGRSYLSSPLEFQMSLRNRALRIIPNVHNIPSIGKYQDGYPQGTRLALIELDPQMLKNNPTISGALATKYGTIDEALTKNIEVYVQIRKVPELSPPFNVILHIWGEAFYEGMFSHNFGVGVFEPNGVVAAGSTVPFNTLGSQNVNRHPGDPGAIAQIAYSPNNMQFNFEGSRKLATFWLIATSPDNNRVCVNFIILARDDATYEPLSLANRTSRTLAQLLDKLYNAQVAEDGGSLRGAVGTIEQLIGVTHETVERGAATADPIMLNDPGDLPVK